MNESSNKVRLDSDDHVKSNQISQDVATVVSLGQDASASTNEEVKLELGIDSNEISDATVRLNTHRSKEAIITWQNMNVRCSVQKNFFAKVGSVFTCNKKEQDFKRIIKNVNGIAKPREVLAILGSSGSGKTTLLNALNFRNQGKFQVAGEVRVNGQLIRSTEMIASISGYVQQDDMFISSLKVKEHLMFQAMLRMDKSASRLERLRRIEEVMVDLNLKKCENTKIGSPDRGIKGISGGERRRLAFASEVLTNPSILFCDEPTTGLDSYWAMMLVDSMKNLARQGKTIICTIHQPSSELFQMFDRYCMMTEGRLAFLGDASNACNFFEAAGHPCPVKYNPADHYIKTLSVPTTPGIREVCLDRVNKLCDFFEKSNEYEKIVEDIKVTNHETIFDEETHVKVKSTFSFQYKTNIFMQTRWLIQRSLLHLLRDPFSLRVLIAQAILMGFLYGLSYYQLEINQEAIQNINCLIFLAVIYISVIYLFSVVNTFPSEIKLFYREQQNGMYTVFAYYTSKTLAELPGHIFLPFVFTVIFYWMSNMNPEAGKFFICSFVLILTAQAAMAFGHFLSAAAPTATAATSLAGPFLGALMIFSGLFLNNSTIPPYFLWLKYFSWLSYANQCLIVNQWDSIKEIACDLDSPRCLSSGKNVMDYLDMDPNSYGYSIGMLLVLIIGWRLMSFIVLLIRSYRV